MPADQIRKVLFISADQWRGECLSALDHPCVRTPNLDALAADGVPFRRLRWFIMYMPVSMLVRAGPQGLAWQ